MYIILMNSLDYLLLFSASIRLLFWWMSSVNLSVNWSHKSFQVNAAANPWYSWAACPLYNKPYNAFCLFSFSGQNQGEIFFSNNFRKSPASSFGLNLLNFSRAKSGYATKIFIFVFYLTEVWVLANKALDVLCTSYFRGSNKFQWCYVMFVEFDEYNFSCIYQ